MPRLFLAIDISEPVRQSLAGALSWMRTFGDCIKIVPAENYHLTLKFLGAIGVERISGIQTALEAAAQNVSACDLRLDGWGVFPPRGAPKVFWIGVEPREVLVPIFLNDGKSLARYRGPSLFARIRSRSMKVSWAAKHLFIARWDILSFVHTTVSELSQFSPVFQFYEG